MRLRASLRLSRTPRARRRCARKPAWEITSLSIYKGEFVRVVLKDVGKKLFSCKVFDFVTHLFWSQLHDC